ncbi:MAG: CTP synthase (glutamine hydrolyzing) [Candidatus Aenigmarchaeota archaeon]|nr:CTP synthase (glutamine hydrolyzing) [Candidatus Aenigmarchaeota archaeon]
MQKPAYIFVTGGVISGLGKGIVASSIGKILQWRGLKVTAMKLDGYLNFDAGTLRPTEHGEVWVTSDGGEIDEDLGHYERFLGMNISKLNNLTSGQVYLQVIKNEREGKYLGKTVQLIPHVTEEIKRRIKFVGRLGEPDVVIVEIGGTVGDYESTMYFEAARQMRYDGDWVVFVHLSYLPMPNALGEPKTKPTQSSVRDLLGMGIQPNIIIGRSERPLDEVRRRKIALFCNVEEGDVFSDHDVKSIYELPVELERQGLGASLCQKLRISNTPANMGDWKELVERIKKTQQTVNIGIVGKYFGTGEFELPDSYISVVEALRHAAWYNNRKAELHWIDATLFEKDLHKLSLLEKMDGIVVPGGYGNTGIEGKINAIRFARESNIPFLGLCYGLQLAVVEYARNVCGMEGANTTEVDKETKYPVIDFLPSQRKITEASNYGATMRLGDQTVRIIPNTLASKLYGSATVTERFRHRYEVNPDFVSELERNGFTFSGTHEREKIMQIGEITRHRFFLGTQFHPEFTSRPLKPNPLFIGFIKSCMH